MPRSVPAALPYWIATLDGWWCWILICCFVAVCWQFPVLLLISLLVLLRAADQWVTWRMLSQLSQCPA